MGYKVIAMKNKIIKAVILAGGSSQRLKAAVPKQLLKINNKPLLVYTLEVFQRCKAVNSIILVVHKKYIIQCHNLIKSYRLKKIEQLIIGGRTRQQSVFNALRAIKDCGYVVIHDGARPFVTEKNILEAIKAVKTFKAVTCAVKATDTIVETKATFIGTMLPRNKLWHIQTPQAFKFDLLFKAHQKARSENIFNSSDDAQLLLGLKKRVKLIEGSYKNIKITSKPDLLLCKTYFDRK